MLVEREAHLQGQRNSIDQKVRTRDQPHLECGSHRPDELGLDSGKYKCDEGMGNQDNEDERPRRKKDEGWMTYRKRTARTMGILWRKMKLTHFCEPVAKGVSPKPPAGVTYEGVVPLVAEALNGDRRDGVATGKLK